MFTGIITEVGHIRAIASKRATCVTIGCAMDRRVAIGASIACSACLTVVDRGSTPGTAGSRSTFQAKRSAALRPRSGRKAHPQSRTRAGGAGDRTGGHIVTGHLDAHGPRGLDDQVGGSWRVIVSAPVDSPYIAAKGSITVDGVWLAVNEVADQPDGACHSCSTSIHQGEVAALGTLVPGREVDVEIDVLARYLKRMQSTADAGLSLSLRYRAAPR